MPPHAPGTSRRVPLATRPDVGEHVRRLLHQKEGWVRRPDWARFMRTGDDRCVQPMDGLTRDQFVAIHAWLRQQRHALHLALEGSQVAPEGWVESLPLYSYVRDRARLDY